MPKLGPGWEVRFYQYVDSEPDENGCHIWVGRLNTSGYGYFYLDGAMQRAHRVAVELSGRVIPEGHVVRHSCDVPECVNPDHLIVGTYAENAQDGIDRGRYPGLSVKRREELHRLARAREIPVAELSRMFGVDPAAVSVLRRFSDMEDVRRYRRERYAVYYAGVRAARLREREKIQPSLPFEDGNRG